MQPAIFCILLAVCVGLLGWGIGRVLLNPDRDDRKRVQQRLSGERRRESVDPAERSILLATQEMSGLSGALARQTLFQALAKKLHTSQPGMTLVKFFVITSIVSLILFITVFVITFAVPVAGVAAAIGAYIPFWFITGKGARRQRSYGLQLPEALDFLSRILRAGHSLSTGLQMMGTEMPEPLAGEFRRAYDQHSLGNPLEECLKDMATRIDSTDFSFFVTAVLIQRQTGGDLSQVLNNISGMIRGRIRLQSYVKAKTAEGRFTGYILVAFPVLMFFIAYTMNPQYSGVLLHTDTGLKLLGVAGGLEVIGLIAINKLTTVKV